ncbi:hypothetical protein B0H19DRAFT_1271946 [Mycena capillaripes]|nr:hypothetical protein B0H19DRAFT_1271946 [Mycena capillaripes]
MVVLQRISSPSSPALMKRLLPRPLSGHLSPAQYIQLRFHYALPSEIFIEIASFLETDQLLSFSLTVDTILLFSHSTGTYRRGQSSQFRTLLLPMMYSTIALESSRACLSGLNMLFKRPELCVYVRTLIVKPNYAIACWPRTEGPLCEIKVAAMITALADKLNNLEKFAWGGLELPPNALWSTLRHYCPQLKKISSTAGCIIDPESEASPSSHLNKCAMPDALPLQLWDMLLTRCPSLEELTLHLFHSSHSLLELTQLTKGIFPRLHTLHLQICLPQPPLALLAPFLAAHPTLTELSIHPSAETLTIPLRLPATALPRLAAFTGVYPHVAALPHPAALERLDLTGLPLSAADIAPAVAALRNLVALHTLDVRLATPALLCAVVGTCPGLTTLRVMIPANFGMKTLRAISRNLQHLPHLRTFTLYKGHRLTDAPMLQCALALLRANPALRSVHLAWFALGRSGLRRRQNGSYEVRTGLGGARYVEVRERGVRGAGVGGGVFARGFRYAVEGKGKGLGLGASVGRGLARIRR